MKDLIEKKHKILQTIVKEIAHEIVGKEEEIKLILTAFFARGHVLIEDLPGLGKTSLAKAISKVIHLDFNRIQGSTDLLPSDIVGVNIFNPSESSFELHRGPIFTQILLFDEMNRTPPKTQSALLQVMAENQVTIDQDTYDVKTPFFVIGTQNPVSSDGTYRLPDSQLDRFSIRLSLGYPKQEQEKNIILGLFEEQSCNQISINEILEIQTLADKVHVEPAIVDYLLEIVEITRQDNSLSHGISVRGSIEMIKLAKVRAIFENRDFVIPEDIKILAPNVLAHRVLSLKLVDRAAQENYIKSILEQVTIPA
ncbi:MAG: MoxR family ATPase [Candidatus Cloacimonetes bacterium]|nr:MoxR family ATPase [Candidatus Cloacimonadota bacterium]